MQVRVFDTQAKGEDGTTIAWGGLTADVNDIIVYNGSNWAVAFDASTNSTDQFVLNTFTSKQLYWDGDNWTLALDGTYHSAPKERNR